MCFCDSIYIIAPKGLESYRKCIYIYVYTYDIIEMCITLLTDRGSNVIILHLIKKISSH